jgi:hypothetical protein
MQKESFLAGIKARHEGVGRIWLGDKSRYGSHDAVDQVSVCQFAGV